MLNGKIMMINLIVGLIKKEIAWMSEYFPRPKSLGANVKVELDLSNYATKTDLKTATGVDTSPFSKNIDLANLKSAVDKLDIDKLKIVPSNLSNLKSKVDTLDAGKLETTPVDLSKLSNVVKIDVGKKTEYNKLNKKLNNISTDDTSDLVKILITTQKLMKLKIK